MPITTSATLPLKTSALPMRYSNIRKRLDWTPRTRKFISDLLKSIGDLAEPKRHRRRPRCLKSYRRQSLVPRSCEPNLSKLMLPISKGWLWCFTSRRCISVSLLLLSASWLSEPSPEIFTDVTQRAGIHWQQFSGESPDRFLIETMGGGVAFLDFDGDGLQDIFFVNGGETPHGKTSAPVLNALYRNLGNGKFEEVAAKTGVDRVAFYGMGVSAADYDNDGFQDLYVTGFPGSALFHNNRNGTFTDVTDKAGVKNAGRWRASAAWFDY